MTAPVRYTREEMAGAVADCAAEARQRAENYVNYPRYHRRYTDEANMLDAAAAMLRQAAADGILSPAEAFDRWFREYRLRTTPLQTIHVTPLSATPTDPPPPPVAEPRGTCGTCAHFNVEGPMMSTGQCYAPDHWVRVPPSGSGFCHLWEAK